MCHESGGSGVVFPYDDSRILRAFFLVISSCIWSMEGEQ